MTASMSSSANAASSATVFGSALEERDAEHGDPFDALDRLAAAAGRGVITPDELAAKRPELLARV